MSEDIKLIPLAEEHLEQVRNWRNNPEVAKYMYTDNYITAEQQISWFSKIRNDDSQRHWIVSYDNQWVGVANLVGIRMAPFFSCSMGLYLGPGSIRGAKIGSKIQFHLLEYAFEELKLNRLIAEAFAFNTVAIGLYEKFGFRREAHFQKMVFKNGIFNDVIGLAILKEEWEAVRSSMRSNIYSA